MKIPKHLWIIMDWNRRWAKSIWKSTLYWHTQWALNIKEVTLSTKELWIKYLTLWCLSTENIKNRSKLELEWLYQIFNKLNDYIDLLNEHNIKLEVIGNLDLLPQKTKQILNNIELETKSNDSFTLILAIWYWWRDEIIRWIKKLSDSWIDLNSIDEETFNDYLDSWKNPNPDLIIRTWWDQRLSWFLLYSSAYSEYYFTEKKWPEFWEQDLNDAIDFFNWTKRNFWS